MIVDSEITPRLVAITGALKGTIFVLSEDEAMMGREATNMVRLNEPSVSRRHCLIRREENQFKVLDLESFNGTFVNGIPVKEQLIEHGDLIMVGDVLMLFLTWDEETEINSGTVHIQDEGLIAHSTVQLRREDALYLYPERLVASLPPTARLERAMNALLKISMEIISIQSLADLQQKLFEEVVGVIPAERGALLLVGADKSEFISAFGWNKSSEDEKTIHVSRTVVGKVLQEGVAVMSNDVEEGKIFGRIESLVASRVRSLLCVPLTAYEKVLGVIYLDTSDPAQHFDEEHLQLMTAIAGIASLSLNNIRQLEWLKGENKRLSEESISNRTMIGESKPMREIYQVISRLACNDATVLIRGESGTGKELAARAIHDNGPRSGRAFQAINCAALNEQLIESELFGHERGAFTGAVSQKKGKLEAAEGGTVFLDEVGELPLVVQAKLLRVLQEREFERVGGIRSIKVDVRLIAATNKDLEEAISKGTFRQDLYYRLNVISLEMPPLRERCEDILLLANFFVLKYSHKCKRRVSGISSEARACLMEYGWPGNVRELENAIERAVVLGTTEFITLEDLTENIIEGRSSNQLGVNKYYEAIENTKRQLILTAIDQAKGSYVEAAKSLGIHPNNLHRLIRTLNLKSTLKSSK